MLFTFLKCNCVLLNVQLKPNAQHAACLLLELTSKMCIVTFCEFLQWRVSWWARLSGMFWIIAVVKIMEAEEEDLETTKMMATTPPWGSYRCLLLRLPIWETTWPVKKAKWVYYNISQYCFFIRLSYGVGFIYWKHIRHGDFSVLVLNNKAKITAGLVVWGAPKRCIKINLNQKYKV